MTESTDSTASTTSSVAQPPPLAPLVDWSPPAPAETRRVIDDEPEPAGHVGRFLAYLIDGFVVSLLAIAIIIIVGGISGGGILVLLGYLAILGYFPYFWSRSGQTPGMAVFNLRLVRTADLGKVGVGAAIIRLLGLWLGAAVFYIGIIWILFEGKRRGWHDLFAGTRMIKDPG